MDAPLHGITVVALEQVVAAPMCTRTLGDLGARVIKVENPVGGDFARDYDDVVNGMAAHFVWMNRGKESVTLDLKSAGGMAVLHRLLAVKSRQYDYGKTIFGWQREWERAVMRGRIRTRKPRNRRTRRIGPAGSAAGQARLPGAAPE